MAQATPTDAQPSPPAQETQEEFLERMRLKVVESFSLLPPEFYWRDRALWLESQGYKLRPRYQPGWVPNVSTSETVPLNDEEFVAMMRAAVVDATRTKDGKRVLLKRIVKSDHPFEVGLTKLLSAEPLSADPLNHCVPVLDEISPPNEPDVTYLVLPFLQQLTCLPFDTFGEIVDFVKQLFTGVQYLHHHHIAHRDIGIPNILMEGEQMFPEGWNHFRGHLTPRGDKHSTFFRRSLRPPKYYLIDFGLSRQYDASETNPLEPPIAGGDRSVPEFTTNKEAFNPFQTDIYYTGNTIRRFIMTGDKLLVNGYYGAGFLNPLIKDMVQKDPEKRPTIDEVMTRFEAICKKLSDQKLRSRPIPRKGRIIKGIRNHLEHRKRMKEYIEQGIPAIPSRQPSTTEAVRESS
ncbi:hypothetical protein BDN72DRAFT_833667 [Pluteus cervinus]|uniref:Uncharacterized protein n=1 Tax=Pluteus cervinus TaxID=181527 RepID=A0ACD3B903_9AGAR|nr:hypothetical protein BDN72DRAFT_833667 [Pluteus cervinus]